MTFAPRQPPVWFTCRTCGARFKVYASSLRHGSKTGKFCRRACVRAPHLTALNTPDRNREIARDSAPKRSAKLRGRATGRGNSYPKLYGMAEHRVVMETVLGRALDPAEIVHHRNEDKQNPTSTNLKLTNRGDHFRHHVRKEVML